MVSINTAELYCEIHRLQKQLLGADRRYWINDFTLFNYPLQIIQEWKQKLETLINQDLHERPDVVRNGGD